MPSKIKRRIALKEACLQHYTASNSPILESEEAIIVSATETLNNLAHSSADPFKKGLPVKPGLYRMRCTETKGEWVYVALCRFKLGKHLRVHEASVGEMNLLKFNSGRTNVEWEHLA